ncbi:MAG: GTP 3',8-cyclase MoaA [Rhodocyclaceae bacterium]
MNPGIATAIAASPQLCDRFGRRVDYIRVSVTDRCDHRCSYCMPAGAHAVARRDAWLSSDEIVRLLAAFAREGVRRVRLTGGEPLLRHDLPQLAARIRAIAHIEDLSLSTNGTQLTRHARALRRAGVDRLNISLDSLDRSAHARIAGRDSFDEVMAGIDAALAEGFAPIKLNMVVMAGVNAHEVNAMADFAMARGLVLRLIETMPIGPAAGGRLHVALDAISAELVARLDLVPDTDVLGGGPARYWRQRRGGGRLGFITPLSQHFCATCNRVRLAVDGVLHTCLGHAHSFPFRPLLRGGASDAALAHAIHQAIALKPRQHTFNEQPLTFVRLMSQTGG